MNKGVENYLKKITISLSLACVILLSACSKENENQDVFVSQEQWISVADNSFIVGDVSEEQDVFLVEPIKSVDQVASYEESQSVINLISRLSADNFTIAMVYDANALEPLPDDQPVLLFEGEISNTKIYGYESAEYGSRGIILNFNGEYFYFDLAWPGNRGGMEFYEQDFDHDGIVEIAFCFEGAAGTGAEIYRLVMFDDVEGTGTLAAYEFTPEMQREQFENKLQFVVDLEAKKINITKDGVTETTIDWERFEYAAEGNIYGIDCFNHITFDISEGGIKMCAGIGILLNRGGPTIYFEAEEGGELYFDILYSDGGYEIK